MHVVPRFRATAVVAAAALLMAGCATGPGLAKTNSPRRTVQAGADATSADPSAKPTAQPNKPVEPAFAAERLRLVNPCALIEKDGQKLGVSQGVLVSIDNSGAVRAMVGGYDYAHSQFDRASEARRQPGSAFKPFVYLAALEAGRTPDSVRNDAPIRIGKWKPENYKGKYHGKVTLTDENGGVSTVTIADVKQSNGVIHVVDAVILPKM